MNTNQVNQDVLLSDEQIEYAFKNTNFGSNDYRAILLKGLRSTALGYHNGWTLTQIIRTLNLGEPKDIDSNKLNERGLRFIEQAATYASESEINSLKQRVEELQADNTIMRDTLNKIALGHVYDADIIESAGDCLQRLCTTQSLAQHDNAIIDRCKNIVADDALAITFQSMGAYRSAIIKQICELKVTP